MTLPTKVLRATPSAFSQDLACLGTQLVTLLELIEIGHPSLRWYLGDIQTIGPSPIHGRSPIPVLLGDTNTLVQAARNVEQFESGVFSGVPTTVSHPKFRDGGLFTEDEEAADLGDAIVELRAFDTTYWSIATTESDLSDAIQSWLEAVQQ